ncbi:ABC transporter permease [Deinococcus aquaedulcis]|uniref:ABC transporter permease n=1 Tax=Deinococcus aquaedulcis TaxID=2840455 RepID=UPI001C836227|nr:ABC transporter permease [Deinococcus aquaedulcis]
MTQPHPSLRAVHRPGPAMAAQRTLAIARKEFMQLRRDPVLLRFILIFPVALLVIFGFALNTKVTHIPLVVVDESADRVSQNLQQTMGEDDRFALTTAPSLATALEQVRQGEARAALHIPKGAIDAVRGDQSLDFTVYVDGSDPTVSSQIRANAAAAAQDTASTIAAARALRTNTSATPPVSPEVKVLFNPDDRTAVYIVPGMIGLILTLVGCLLTAIVIVREREMGTMEGLIATPVRPLEVVLGKITPYFVFGLIDAVLVVLAGVLVFRVPFQGSPLLLAGAMLLFILGSLGVGIVISTFVRTQIQSVFWIIAYFFPSIFLSGLFFPLEGMVQPFGFISHLVPLRHFLELARGVMIRGADLSHLATPMLALALFSAATLLIANFRFKKTL